MKNLTPSQRATALDRLASRAEGFTSLGVGYSFGIVSRPLPSEATTEEEIIEQTVWGITYWDAEKLGSEPTQLEIEEEALRGPVPGSVTPRQIRLALIDRGTMPEDITAQLGGISDPVLRAKSLAEWEFAPIVERNHPLINQLADSLEFTQEDVDDLFREASKL